MINIAVVDDDNEILNIIKENVLHLITSHNYEKSQIT